MLKDLIDKLAPEFGHVVLWAKDGSYHASAIPAAGMPRTNSLHSLGQHTTPELAVADLQHRLATWNEIPY